MPSKIKLSLLSVITVLGVLLALFLPAIPQDPAYHQFADQRQMFGISNFVNVTSNIPFILFGGMGIYFIARNRFQGGLAELQTIYQLFFMGTFLTGFGSIYYHLQPTSISLMWDRLPMTLVFISFFCIVVGEHISALRANRWLWPLLLFGVFSVMYWQWGEIRGHGDLRFYALVQFLLPLLIVVILLMFPSPFGSRLWIVLVLLVYALAKVAEQYDVEIFALTNAHFSGHALKHLLAALVSLLWMTALYKRLLQA